MTKKNKKSTDPAEETGSVHGMSWTQWKDEVLLYIHESGFNATPNWDVAMEEHFTSKTPRQYFFHVLRLTVEQHPHAALGDPHSERGAMGDALPFSFIGAGRKKPWENLPRKGDPQDYPPLAPWDRPKPAGPMIANPEVMEPYLMKDNPAVPPSPEPDLFQVFNQLNFEADYQARQLQFMGQSLSRLFGSVPDLKIPEEEQNPYGEGSVLYFLKQVLRLMQVNGAVLDSHKRLIEKALGHN